MEHDPDRRRFFGYLNLFVAAMLLLVLADSYLLLYVGWEGVGLASYLLIGFWNYNPAYAAAAKKAFVVNRVGDFGLSVAIMIMFVHVRRRELRRGVRARADGASEGDAHRDRPDAAARRLRQVGAVPAAVLARRRDGRPDAGVGADPRRNDGHRRRLPHRPVRRRSSTARPTPSSSVVIVGAVTLLFGAIIGCAKDDIKKALAASTMSQIGYMMLAAGLGPVGYAFAIFHLLTHGFFKAGHVPRCRLGHARHERPGRHAPLRRAVARHEDHLGHVRPRLAGDHRRSRRLSGFWSKDKIIEAAFVGDGWRPGCSAWPR